MAAGSNPGRLVLVADPDLGFADALSAILPDDRVIGARSIGEAAAIAEGRRIDVAILGPGFGSVDGASSASALRDADPGLLTVLVAEVPSASLLRAALRAGLADVVDAPITPRKLAEVLARTDAIDEARSIDVVLEGAHADSGHHAVSDDEPLAEIATESVSHGYLAEAVFEDAFAVAFGEPIESRPDGLVERLTISEPPIAHAEPPPAEPPPVEPETPALMEYPLPVAEALSSPGPDLDSPPVPEADAAFAPPEPALDAPLDPAIDAQPDLLPQAPNPTPHLPPDAPPMPASPPPLPDEPSGVETLSEVIALPVKDPQSEPVVRRRPGGGKVITVMSGKGGSGKTITATNLAASLTEKVGEDRVVIVDADLQFGDVALLLQIDPTRTIVDVAAVLDGLSESRLDSMLMRHESGLRVLPAPMVPAGAEKVGPKDVVRTVEMLRGIYDYVVVDTAPIFDDALITMLEHSDDVLMVVDMDLPSVKNARIALDTLRAIGYDVDRVHLAVNRANSKARLDMAELERALGEEVVACIPSDRLVPQSVNEGVPAVAFSPRSRVAKAFHELAALFVSDSAPR